MTGIYTVKHKGGFFIKALKDGFFTQEMESKEVKKQKQEQAIATAKEKKEAEESAAQEKKQLLEKLREQHQTPELVEEVLATQEGNRFMYPMLKEKRDQKIIHKYLQAFIDKRLMEKYGG